MSKSWWDESYPGSEQPLFQMQIEAPEQFDHVCGFVRLRERHRVKAGRRAYSPATCKNEQYSAQK